MGKGKTAGRGAEGQQSGGNDFVPVVKIPQTYCDSHADAIGNPS